MCDVYNLSFDILIIFQCSLIAMLEQWLLVVGVVVLCLGWLLYTPIPTGYKKPWQVHVAYTQVNILWKTVSSSISIPYPQRWDIVRSILWPWARHFTFICCASWGVNERNRDGNMYDIRARYQTTNCLRLPPLYYLPKLRSLYLNRFRAL